MPAVRTSKMQRRKNAERAVTKLISAHKRRLGEQMAKDKRVISQHANNVMVWWQRFSDRVRDELIAKAVDCPERLLLMTGRQLDALGVSDKARAEIDAYRKRFRVTPKAMGVSI